MAARAGDIAKLKAYIADGMEVGARVNAEEPTALVQAARKSRVDAVQCLLTQKPSLTDKKDALLAVAFELAFASDDVGNITRLKQIVASILGSEPDARSLINDVVGSLQARGESAIAHKFRNLFH
jgi:ankyrin repeat protein